MSYELEHPHLATPVGVRDHVRGDSTAPLTLLEYGDYECPYCGAAYPRVAEVLRILGDDVAFVFRNFPLTEVHPHALQAAETAEAASAHGRFWEMHDFLFEHQKRLRPPDRSSTRRRSASTSSGWRLTSPATRTSPAFAKTS